MKTIEETLYDALSIALKRVGLKEARITGCDERKDYIIFRYKYRGKERMLCLEKKADRQLDPDGDHVNAAEQALRLMGADKFRMQF